MHAHILQRFFGSDGARAFLQDCWPGRPHVHDGEMARLGEIAALPEFHDIRLLLQQLPGHVDLVHPDGRRQIVHRPLDALPAYLEGTAMLYLKDIECLDAVARVCDELAELLGVPRRYIGCEAFAAIGSVDVPLHFDHETNFMLQLRGSKTWRYAPNCDLPNPVFPYFPANPNRYYDDGRNPYTGSALPREFPASLVERIVHPGTVTFMPRGYWHATRTHEESLAIGFVIDPPTMAELVLAPLLARLHAKAEFRAHPLSAPDHEGRAGLERQLLQILTAVQASAAELTPAAMLEFYRAHRPANTRGLSQPR
jgi:50S ribosomal protein L16 3-hydroxylase